MALPKSIQTVHFVQEWHKDADVLWITQEKVDGKLASQVAYLQQSILLRDQLVSLQKQVRPRCDWNYTSFCVMAFKYNKTQFNWDKVKCLLNQGNISVDIQDLQQNILKAFKKHLDVISGSDFLDTVADNLPSLKTDQDIWIWNCSGYGSAINYAFMFLYSLEKNDQETMKPTTATNISHHFSSCAKSKRARCMRQEE